VQVRQDKGVQPGAEAPDWELIDKLNEIAEKEEIEVPDVPEAPDLDAVAQTLPEDGWNLGAGEDLWPSSSSEEE
jgi:hypothetical protein